MMSLEEVKNQAKLLAAENRMAEPDILEIYWFPDEAEVRLVETLPTIPASGDGRLHPYHFRANRDQNLPHPSGVALIRPDEVGRLTLPEKWGDWDEAIPLEEE
jgi:hypothetical protein